MSKKGFTLAEVLITLSIIGVIAALTVPAVTKSYEKATYIAGYKRTYATTAEAVKLIMAENDGTIQGLTPSEDAFVPLLTAKLKTTKTCTWANTLTDCWHASNNWYTLDGAPNTSANLGLGFITNNGVLYQFFASGDTTCELGGNPDSCGYFTIDLNGFKGPNVVGKDIHRISLTTTGIQPLHLGTGNCGTEGGCCNKNETPEGKNGGKNCGYEILTSNYDWEN